MITILKSLSTLTRLLLPTFTMNSNTNNHTTHGSTAASNQDNSHSTGSNEAANPTTNPHAHVTSTAENSHGYPPFEMSLVLNYMNNQIIYYYMTGAISAAEQKCFHQLMKK